MIYTVTLNPSLDYLVEMEHFRFGAVNRVSGEQIFAGGKGINVSYVLKHLGFESTAMGFLAGFVGNEIERRLKEDGIRTEFLMLEDGVSRINVKLRNINDTEINGMGPEIGVDKEKELREKLRRVERGDLLILAGSIPRSMSAAIYRDIMSDMAEKSVKVVVDAAKDLLMNVLPYHPFLIKPNHHELGEIFGVQLDTMERVVPYARKLQDLGARNVLVSMAGAGAVLLDENGCEYSREAPEGRVVNAVGAGDSMVAGFIAGYLETGNYEHAFHKGLAAGSASAFSEQLATKEEVEVLLKAMEVL